MKISYLNPAFGDLSFERQLLRGTDIELVETVVNNADEVHRATKDAEAILTAFVPIDAGVVANLQKCGVIVRLGVGYEIVDLASCRQKGIHVCNVPDYGTEEVANHAVALLFAVHRRIVSYDRSVRNRQWGHVLPWPIHRLSTLRVGVVGLGRIGGTFARSIKPFVRDVVGFDPFLAANQLEAIGVLPTSLEALFETSDIISLHLPLSEKTRHLVSTRTIASMKRKPIIINASRGGLIDGGALAYALEKGELSGAGIDVFEDEPNVRSELLGLENIVLTPHVAWYSEEAELQLRRSAIEEIIRVLAGHPPKNPV
jgi:D-3-phosphoglycerate dehydrogenase / 2-oxoglutarate reductase